MSVTNRLVFDPAEAASHSNVGAYIRAGSDGDLIASQTIAAEEWLNVASALHDGSGNAISSTGGALDVNIASSSLTVNADDSLANTAIENTATLVSATAVKVVSSALANRKWLYLANEGNKTLFFGKTGVTTANGFPLYPGMQQEYRIGAAVAPQIIGDAGATYEDLRVMELS